MATVLVVCVDVRPEAFDEFLGILRRHAEHSVASEDGCLDFQLLKSVDKPNQVVLVETYADDAALEAHWQSAHMNHYRERTANMILDRQRFRCVSD